MGDKVYRLYSGKRPTWALRELGFKHKAENIEKHHEIQFRKALSYGFTKIIVPFSSHEEISTLRKNTDIDLTPVIEGADFDRAHLSDSFIVLISCEKDMSDILLEIKSGEIIFLITKNFRPSEAFLSTLRNQKTPYYFYFPLKISLGDIFLSTRQIKNYIIELEKNEFEVRPYPGLNVFEKRAVTDIDFYPILSPVIATPKKVQIEHSIVIPVYGQEKELLRTLECLKSQTIADNIEFIIVDDGQNPTLLEKIKTQLGTLKINQSLKFIINPRIYPRSMGDGRFRAGISRSIGAREAAGTYLHFLDADVLTPDHYLETVKNELADWDLVQIKRYDLTRKFSESLRPISEIDPSVDIIHLGRDYWYRFYDMKQGWHELDNAWKYVCTYGISMKRSMFEEIGGIRTNYIFYGFEDTDLGYRLQKYGARFKISDTCSYHQFHESSRSEFKNSHRERRRVMSKSGQIFFLNNLSVELYHELIDYISPSYSLKAWIKLLFEMICLRPFKNRKIQET